MNLLGAWFIGIAFLILGTRVTAAVEQNQPASAVSQAASDAATAYEGKDWPKSAKLYAQIVETAPSPPAWYRLGVSLNKIGETTKPSRPSKKAERWDWPRNLWSTELQSSSRRKKTKKRRWSTWKRLLKMV